MHYIPRGAVQVVMDKSEPSEPEQFVMDDLDQLFDPLTMIRMKMNLLGLLRVAT